MTAQHTPGPWRLTTLPEGRWVEVYGGHPEDDVAQAVGVPNARLIAAAPELLEALERISAIGEWLDDDQDVFAACYRTWVIEARAAIAKAKGGRE